MSFPAYWLWNKNLPEHIINAAIAEAREQPSEKGQVGADDLYAINLVARDVDVVMHPSWHWLAGVLMNYAIHANAQAGWGYTIHKPECLQLTKYGINQHHDKHTDSDVLNSAPSIRKLSVVCALTDEYEGGDLEIFSHSRMKLSRGDVIVFHSSLEHKVHPVTAGERITAVSWMMGPNIR